MTKTPIKNLSQTIRSSIIDDYKLNYLTLDKLAEKYNYSNVAISNFLNSQKVNRRSLTDCHRKYSINENYFSKINTEEKAYFLGLLYADGYLNEKRHAISLQLQEKDRAILDTLNKSIGSSRPLLFINSKKYNPNSSNCYRLNITNKKITEDLLNIGIFQNKSLSLKFPSRKIISNRFLNHFIRGYFDGDGSQSLYFPKRNNRSNKSMQSDIKILSTIEFITEAIFRMQSVNSNLQFSVTKRFKDNINCYNLVVSGNAQVLEFMSYIYNKSSIYLNRKKQRFEEFKSIVASGKNCKAKQKLNLINTKAASV